MNCDPLFLFGIARSGTNLVAGMLNARSDVSIALDPLMPFFKALRSAIVAATGDAAVIARYPEQVAFQDYYFDALGIRLLDAIMRGSLDHPLAANASLAEAVARRAALESQTLPEAFAQLRSRSFSGFLMDVIEAVRSHASAPLRWCGTKEVWTTEFIPVFARAMPRAKFIVIRRDPRSVLASLLAMMRKDEAQTAHTISYMRHWRKEAAVLDAIVADPSLRERVLAVQYEAIAAAPEQTAGAICAFLDLPFDPVMLTPAAVDGSVLHGNSSFGDISGIAKTSIDRWKAVLDCDTVRTVECLCGPEMRAEGYEPINSWPILPDAAVQRVAAEADVNSGSWRSDSGDMASDIAAEGTRLNMLLSGCARVGADIRRHFLFESFFERLRAAARHRALAAAAVR